MSIELDRITHPLRLAKGSHQPGSGKGCAMNVISYINGDAEITDFPACSARPLSKLVQMLNDGLADEDGYLSPKNSVLVLNLGWRTVGTADVPREVVLRWLAELLVNPVHGVVQHANPEAVPAIRHVAELLGRQVAGGTVSGAEWIQARTGAYAVNASAYASAYASAAANAAASAAASAAVYASAPAYVSAAVYASAAAYAAADDPKAAISCAAAAAYAAANAAVVASANAVGGYANIYAHIYAGPRVEFTRWAIEKWRELAKLDEPQPITAVEINNALKQIGSHA